MRWSYTYTPPTRLQALERENLTFFYGFRKTIISTKFVHHHQQPRSHGHKPYSSQTADLKYGRHPHTPVESRDLQRP